MRNVRRSSKVFPRPETRSKPIPKREEVITLPMLKKEWQKKEGYEFGPKTIIVPMGAIVDNCELLKFASVVIIHNGQVIIDPIKVQNVETVIIAVDDSKGAIEVRYQGKVPPIEVAFALMEIVEPNGYSYGNATDDYKSAVLFKTNLQYFEVEEAEAEFPVEAAEVFASA